jgi:hypothetical protein
VPDSLEFEPWLDEGSFDYENFCCGKTEREGRKVQPGGNARLHKRFYQHHNSTFSSDGKSQEGIGQGNVSKVVSLKSKQTKFSSLRNCFGIVENV